MDFGVHQRVVLLSRADSPRFYGQTPGLSAPPVSLLSEPVLHSTMAAVKKIQPAKPIALLLEAPIPYFKRAVVEHRSGQSITCLTLVQFSMHATT